MGKPTRRLAEGREMLERLARGESCKSIAQSLHLRPETVHRFKDRNGMEIALIRRGLIDAVVGKLSGDLDAVAGVLADIALDSGVSHAVRVRAASELLSRFVALRETLMLEDRLAAVEALLYGARTPDPVRAIVRGPQPLIESGVEDEAEVVGPEEEA